MSRWLMVFFTLNFVLLIFPSPVQASLPCDTSKSTCSTDNYDTNNPTVSQGGGCPSGYCEECHNTSSPAHPQYVCAPPYTCTPIKRTDPGKLAACSELENKQYAPKGTAIDCGTDSYRCSTLFNQNLCIADTGAILCYTSPTTTSGDNACGISGIKTAVGCVETEPKAFVQGLLKVATLAGGGIALLLMVFGAFKMITSGGNAESLKAGQEQFTSAAIGLLFVIFSVLLMQIIGVNILGLPGFG